MDLLSDLYRIKVDGAPILTEEKQYPRTQHAPLMRVRDLTADISGPVRIMGIVLKSDPGSALVQDIYDDVDKAKSLWVLVEGTLNPEECYLLIGTVIERKISSGKEIRLNVSIAHNINSLDISQYKEALELEEKIVQTMSK